MEDYTQTEVTEGLTNVNKNGVHLNSVTHSYKTTINREANIQGTKLMKVKGIPKVVRETVSSKTDAELFAYIMENCKKYNVVNKHSSQEPATTTYLAKKFKVSVQKVRAYFRKAIKSDFIHKVGGVFFVNPYLIIPYNVGTTPIENDQIANQLQLWWEGDRKNNPIKTVETLSKEDILAHANKSFMKEVLG